MDSIRPHKDPKGGWFGPSLWDIYPKGEDTTEVFCGSGPRVPTGEEITIFFTDKHGTAESSSCRQIIAVAKGRALWDGGAGKPIGEEELDARIRSIPSRRAQSTPQTQGESDQPIPPVGFPNDPNSPGISFTAKAIDAEYRFSWGHGPHGLMEPRYYFLAKVGQDASDPSYDDEAEEEYEVEHTSSLEYYLMNEPSSGLIIFTLKFGEYEALQPDRKALVQGFCKERIRILRRMWPGEEDRNYRLGGWFEPVAPHSNKLKPVCN